MDIMKMMGKARELQSRMGDLQGELKTLEATGEAGAGAVVARVNGAMAIIALTIDEAMMRPEEREVVEDLVIAAVSDAQAKVSALVQERTQSVMGDMGLPAGLKLPF
ncbi:YbaB/EbfC family nucleoid-associated protein [Acuticoccus sp.]|uniref:YbaB/EbfC family nucleoid-associated protein n=1 Tax=Acuticoccus sp. TaxID=1904378 RepID=UPI003B523623